MVESYVRHFKANVGYINNQIKESVKGETFGTSTFDKAMGILLTVGNPVVMIYATSSYLFAPIDAILKIIPSYERNMRVREDHSIY